MHSLKQIFARVAVLCLCGLALGAGQAPAQVPQQVNYQGRIAVSGTNFNGNGQFAFALVSGTSPVTTYWSNDGTSTGGSQPTAAVTLNVTNGLYSVQLGDTTLSNMTAVPASVFTNPDVRLRVWFNDGSRGWQQLTPDQRIATVGYAFVAASVPAGSITADRIAQEYAVFEERSASGVAGTTYGAGWNTRPLTTTAALSGTSISKGSGNTFVLNPGTYLIDAVCTDYDPSQNQAALFDVTNASSPVAVVYGTTDFGRISNASGAAVTSSYVKGYFTVTGSAHTFEVRHYFLNGANTPIPSGSGLPEVYARAQFVRIQ